MAKEWPPESPKLAEWTRKDCQGRPEDTRGRTKGAKESQEEKESQSECKVDPKVAIGPNYIHKLPINRPGGRYVK